jgi:ketosteroid isomerase-like protein
MPFITAAGPSWQQRALSSSSSFIDKANKEWTSAIVSGDPKALSAPYSANAVFIAPDGTASHGKTGIRTMYSRRPSGTKVIRATIRSDGRAAVDPDDVYEWGRAQMTVRRNGRQSSIVGRYLTVWHRSGKQWLITRNIAF